MPQLSGSRPCIDSLFSLFYKMIDQPFVSCIVDMAVQHICFGISLFVPAVLAIITADRIMAQHHFPSVVVKFRIGTDPLKPGWVKSAIGQIIVVVSHDQI